MTVQTVSAKANLEDGSESSGSVEYDFGDDLKSSTDLFGGEVVQRRFKAAAVVDLQGVIRRHLQSDPPLAGKALQEACGEWKPGIQRARKSKVEKAMEMVGDLSDDDRAALIASLKGSKAA